ncbi:MAG: hypothetical protein KJ600_06030 [Nanoarchaeota archaeon]|nr:hypothetical protein [Nanoarchaeota archaeon]MBU1104086.1 hypothetical protein [Nanoarchaeota archaeon]
MDIKSLKVRISQDRALTEVEREEGGCFVDGHRVSLSSISGIIPYTFVQTKNLDRPLLPKELKRKALKEISGAKIGDDRIPGEYNGFLCLDVDKVSRSDSTGRNNDFARYATTYQLTMQFCEFVHENSFGLAFRN